MNANNIANGARTNERDGAFGCLKITRGRRASARGFFNSNRLEYLRTMRVQHVSEEIFVWRYGSEWHTKRKSRIRGPKTERRRAINHGKHGLRGKEST